MNHGYARSVLAGAVLASGLVLGAPLAAEAAASAHAPSSADFGGIQVPSTKAELTQSGSVADGTPVYSEPGSSDMALLIPHTRPTGAAPDQIRMSTPFTAGTSEQWVAVQVPDTSHGLDSAKSNLADAGVAYVRASNVTPSGPAPAAGAYPSAKSDLTMTASTDGSRQLYRHPVPNNAEALPTITDKWGSSMKASVAFVNEGKKWVAVEVAESVAPGGIAYLQVTPGVAVNPGTQTAPTASAAPATSGSSAAAAPAAAPASTPAADAAPDKAPATTTPAAPVPVSEIILKALNVLVAALAMAVTFVLINRRPAEA